MKTIDIKQPINLKVVRFELDFVTPAVNHNNSRKQRQKINVPDINYRRKQSTVPQPPIIKNINKKKNTQDLIDELLEQLYSDHHDWCGGSGKYGQGSTTAASIVSSQSTCGEQTDAFERSFLESLDLSELVQRVEELGQLLLVAGDRLGKCVRTRDRLRRQHKRICVAFNILLRHIRQMSAILNSLRNLAGSSRASSAGDSGARFSVSPGDCGGDGSADGGYAEWLHAMRLVARLPAGVPHHFRKKLWITLADRYLTARGVDWPVAERACFRGTALPDDTELGAQILKDLHRTGCSLFCGTEGRENQAMLRRVLLAYARWNKEVGYCQGFNMLAAIILEVMDKSESDSLKVMIYLVEAVLPEGYFADDLRGLSADMAAFRDLLRLRLPRLANHMDHLQRISDGGGVEPPLPDVFTMQWFLTLYATWLPRESLLRIWDLILLDGNEVLLLTALAIWDMLQDRILSARSADEYYSCMGGGAGAIWEAGEALVARVVAYDSAPELPRLRNLHRYRVTPPAPTAPIQPPVYQPPLHSAMQSMTKRGLRLFYSEDEGDSSDDGNKMALATVLPRRDERLIAGDRLSLDIGALKRQYARLRERQRQAHVILAAACARHAAVGVPTSPTSLTVNNLLLGKSAIVSSRGRRLGPPPGAVPPSRHSTSNQNKNESKIKGRSNDTINWKDENSKKSLSRRNSLKWKDIKKVKIPDHARKASIDLDEGGDGIIVSEKEANEMVATLRSRSSSESSSYSFHSESSTDTSLCDEHARASDSEFDLPVEADKEKALIKKETELTTIKNSDLKITSMNDDEDVNKIKDTLIPFSSSNISTFIETAAGEPLRTYIDEFQDKSKPDDFSQCIQRSYELQSPVLTINDLQNREHINEQKDLNFKLIPKDNSPGCRDKVINETTTLLQPITSDTLIDLSPINTSPCRFNISHNAIRYNYETTFKQPSTSQIPVSRPPDIIDSLTKYPNFVPDIDLSEKTASDFDSPLRSPGAESIVVSEDEPPIPLKIDKYFEHSPEFFGARITITDSNNPDIPNRRAIKRQSRTPKKPDSLTLHSNYTDKLVKSSKGERASSLPQNHSLFKTLVTIGDDDIKISTVPRESNFSVSKTESKHYYDSDYKLKKEDMQQSQESIICFERKIDDELKYHNLEKNDNDENHKEVYYPHISQYGDEDLSKNFISKSGRKNSERALQIIQENSKILSRILTKQNIDSNKATENIYEQQRSKMPDNELQGISNIKSTKCTESNITDSPLLRESTSDSLIGCGKDKNKETCDKNDFLRNRPISLDDPISLELKDIKNKNDAFILKGIKSPNKEIHVIKTDRYGWENKGFLAKREYQNYLEKSDEKFGITLEDNENSTTKPIESVENECSKSHDSLSFDSKTSVTLPSTEHKDTSTYECKFTSDDYNYPLSTKYNDFVLSRASDICSKTVDLGPKICENLSKTDNSQVSDFAHVVTSSISFTYEPSAEDDSPTGAKSNSSDTLCQIASLDQISTPISPKIFPNRDTPTLPKESLEKSERTKVETDDTCSAITSLIETDTLSSLSYPRSPSTGSYHPFPARPVMRMPKELGIRLGMYPRDSINSPSK